MDKKNIKLQFKSSIERITEINDSFSSGVLRICYTGVNRNGSSISKQVLEAAIPSLFNCPVVCNYDIAADTIGGHDMEIVTNDAGDIRLVNLTSAVGVIPESAKVWWESIDDDDVSHEYLVAEALLWKRSPVYRKISEDGITSQSMEISVSNGTMREGIFEITDMTFTALCLLGDDVEPCFESASLQVFSSDEIHRQFSELMADLKENFTQVRSFNEVTTYQKFLEGGKEALDKKKELMAQYGLTEEMLGFSIEDFSVDELTEKFETMKSEKEFALAEQFRNELIDALGAEKIETCFGEMSRYWYVDYDSEAGEVYCYDESDWTLCGFSYSMNGDHVVIDFESKKRKKFAIVDFDEGEQQRTFSAIYDAIASLYESNKSEWEQKYQNAETEMSDLKEELSKLREFKADVETEIAKQERDGLFAKFEDLAGTPAFDALRDDCDNFSIKELEEKCYAIRGRKQTEKFAMNNEPKAPKMPIAQDHIIVNEPYGGVFPEYGIHIN